MATSTHRLRRTGRALALMSLVAIVVGAGCARPDVAGAGPSANPATTRPTNPVGASEGATAATSHRDTASTSGTRCATAQLHVSVAPGDNAAGHIGLNIVFTNASTRACTLYGYPGVSFVTRTGTQVNDPAQRSSALGPPSLVRLAPNSQAHSSLLLVNVANYVGTPDCQPTQVAGIRVYPPDERTSVIVVSAQHICEVKGTGVASVYPVQPGASSS